MDGVPRLRRWSVHSSVVLATTVLTAWVWGGFSAVPAVHDELAYELQCRIFASGAWTAPAAPLPEFFQQFYVFSQPVVASKYWPVHSLLMAPGCVLGYPALVPLLLAGLSGSLVLVLATRVLPMAWALVAWALWVTCPVALEFRASYFSQGSTTALYLAALLLLERWNRTRSRRALALLAGLVALGVAARPLSGLALGVPIAYVVARHLGRDVPSSALRWPAVSLLAGLLVIPLWSYMTLGRLDTTPYSEYARQVFPFDRPGFTFDARMPGEPLPPDMAQHARDLGAYFEAHALPRLPVIALERLGALAAALFGGWRLILAPLIVPGLLAVRDLPSLRVPLAGAGATFLAHLGFAHPASWTLYYVEAFPVVYALTALGAARTATALRLGRERALLAGGVVLVTVFMGGDVWKARVHRGRWQADVESAARAIAAVHGPAIVFVRYSPGWNLAFGLVRNEVSPATAKAWIVRDLGTRNAALRALAPDRAAYLLETAGGRLERLD